MHNQKNRAEKRKHLRINKRILFKLKTDDFDIVAETINLSCIGACCQVNKSIPFMTSLKVAFALPDYDNEKEPKYVTCNGVVVRTEKGSSKANLGTTYNIAIILMKLRNQKKKR